MSEDTPRAQGARNATPTDPRSAADDGSLEPAAAPTPFDHPLFLPAVCVGFTLWFGYDTYLHPMEEHLDFNYYGFKVVLAASAWYGYLALCEIKGLPVRIFVLPAIFAVLALWMGAEAFGPLTLPELVEYPAISRWGFYGCAALVPISALREWLRARRRRETAAA